MIDLVDWAQAKAESNWRRRGFLAKVFSSQEQQFILDYPDPDARVWTFWSMKESVYKLSLTQNQIRRYAPSALECQIISCHSKGLLGKVISGGKTYLTQSVFTTEYVLTTASLTEAFEKPLLVSFENTSYLCQHQTMDNSIRAHLTQRFRLPEPWIQSKTSAGITSFSSLHKRVLIPSTHHGHFGAFIVLES